MGNIRLRNVLPVVLGLAMLGSWTGRAPAAEKLTLEQVIAKHLDSLAPAELRAASRTRASEWTTRFVVKMGGQGMGEGKGVLITEGRKLAFGMKFPVNDYPGEKFVFDGEKWDTARRTTELRSGQADLVLDNNEILREGLFGGVLSTAWALLDREDRKPELKYDGLKKVDGVNLHRVRYTPRKSNNGMQIFLFFDPTTFQHVKTLYVLEIQPGTQAVTYTRNANVRYTPNTRYKLEEDFSDFKTFEGYTLPTKWKVRYTWDPSSGSGITVIDWELVMMRVASNEAVDPKTFDVQTVTHSVAP